MNHLSVFDPATSSNQPYVALAVRTAAPLVGRANLLHALLGIADELSEIYDFMHNDKGVDLTKEETITALVKELGDVTWFCALFADYLAAIGDGDRDQVFGCLWDDAVNYVLPSPTYFVTDDPFALTLAIRTAGKAVSKVKGEYAYGKEIDFDFARTLFVQAMLVVRVVLCELPTVSIDDVLTRNVAKLAARYKGATFTQAEAVNRDETKE